jgi:hypothetical protein
MQERYWRQSEATEKLHNAWGYLWREYWSRASSQSRNFVLPETQDAMDIIHSLAKDSLERSLDLI